LYAFDENGKQFSDQKEEVAAAPTAKKGRGKKK